MLPAPFLHGGQSANSQPREVAASGPRETVYSPGRFLADAGLASRGHVCSPGCCGWPALGRAAEGSGDGDGLALGCPVVSTSACGFHITEARVELSAGCPAPGATPLGSHLALSARGPACHQGPCGQGAPPAGLQALGKGPPPGPSHAVTQLCPPHEGHAQARYRWRGPSAEGRRPCPQDNFPLSPSTAPCSQPGKGPW